jgi:hypothetical protein
MARMLRSEVAREVGSSSVHSHIALDGSGFQGAYVTHSSTACPAHQNCRLLQTPLTTVMSSSACQMLHTVAGSRSHTTVSDV